MTTQVATQTPPTLEEQLTPKVSGGPLMVPTTSAVQAELGLDKSQEFTSEEDKKLLSVTRDAVDKLLNGDLKDPIVRDERIEAVDQLGSGAQRESGKISAMLKQPIRKLSQSGAEGQPVANALVELKVQVETLDPGKFDFQPGFLGRTLGRLPFVGTPLNRYFTMYENSDSVIEAIVRSLKNGRDQLSNDNKSLREDQIRMREVTRKVAGFIRLCEMMDKELSSRLANYQEGSDDYKFVAEELIFRVRQRTMDLQQSLLVNQQGVLATELIIRNNRELIRGVDRALNVTITALNVAVEVALALANQKIVLTTIESVNTTTDNLIVQTAHQLRVQGVEIQKKATSAMLNIDKLKQAFVDIGGALDDISNFRQAALPQMAQSVLDMDDLSAKAEQAIARMERSNKVAPTLLPAELS